MGARCKRPLSVLEECRFETHAPSDAHLRHDGMQPFCKPISQPHMSGVRKACQPTTQTTHERSESLRSKPTPGTACEPHVLAAQLRGLMHGQTGGGLSRTRCSAQLLGYKTEPLRIALQDHKRGGGREPLAARARLERIFRPISRPKSPAISQAISGTISLLRFQAP